ncbi:hypothetical protein [Acinetobacter shaoyimingii]|uniref:DUF4199 domain-containing protein n=1 Tax=Acinetobacter shaoyimingii TaxID=2715164 RepID=A0A6G8RRD5_9GAMM|nr:hypothetical protein [Acinetobacter shaoyimingii]QIO04445.1 hypothetical protein G8E00_03625 [Acinetobacter shaoyimingii]
MSDVTSPEKSPWGWKSLIISAILSCFFLGFFYLAVTNEPDYMPSQNKSAAHSHHSTENATANEGQTAAEMNMTDEEHAAHVGQATTQAAEEAHQKAHDENKEHSH